MTLDTVILVLALLGSARLLLAFAFMGLPYRRRRATADRMYGTGAKSSSTADAVHLIFAIVLAGLILWRGFDDSYSAILFLAGLWVGADVITVYFHRFNEQPPPGRAAPAPTSPLKEMSYAIQDRPSRGWREMTILGVLFVITIVTIVTI